MTRGSRRADRLTRKASTRAAICGGVAGGLGSLLASWLSDEMGLGVVGTLLVLWVVGTVVGVVALLVLARRLGRPPSARMLFARTPDSRRSGRSGPS